MTEEILTMKTPKYESLPVVQTPKVSDGMIVGWTLRLSMKSGDIVHTQELEYTCLPEEVEPVPGNVKTLERILRRVINETTFMEDCEAALKAKIPSTKE